MSAPRRALRRLASLGAVAALTMTVGACSDPAEEAESTPTATSPTAPVLQPGRPGEANRTLTGTEAVPTPTGRANAADVRFMQDMIVHHAQAITMVDLAYGGLTSPEVRRMADRIRGEQKPEIGAMSRWLTQRKQPVPPQATNHRMDHGGHAMPGMASRGQLLHLQKATGPSKDRTFLTLMINHHRGALSMVVLRDRSGGTDPDAEQLGNDISSGQSSQIGHMQRMLGALPTT